MGKAQKSSPPDHLGVIGKAKWNELTAKLAGQVFEYDAMALLCGSWETYRAAHDDIAKNGINYRDSNNGRVWNNPAVNTKAVAFKEIVKLSQAMGIWSLMGVTDEDTPPPGLEDD